MESQQKGGTKLDPRSACFDTFFVLHQHIETLAVGVNIVQRELIFTPTAGNLE